MWKNQTFISQWYFLEFLKHICHLPFSFGHMLCCILLWKASRSAHPLWGPRLVPFHIGWQICRLKGCSTYHLQSLLFSFHILYIVTYPGLWSTNTNSEYAFFQISRALPSRKWCFPQNTLNNIWRPFQLLEVLLESSRYKTRMFLTILQCIGCPPTRKDYPALNVGCAKVKKTLF